MTSKILHLESFTGTENHYKRLGILYTDGVKYLADEGEAYWLIDAIASCQFSPTVKNDPMLQEIQFWNLQVKPDNSAVLTCERDEDDIALTQDIPYTDFPLENVRLYLANRVLMLPSEY
jgi:hypothetical protein